MLEILEVERLVEDEAMATEAVADTQFRLFRWAYWGEHHIELEEGLTHLGEGSFSELYYLEKGWNQPTIKSLYLCRLMLSRFIFERQKRWVNATESTFTA